VHLVFLSHAQYFFLVTNFTRSYSPNVLQIWWVLPLLFAEGYPQHLVSGLSVHILESPPLLSSLFRGTTNATFWCIVWFIFIFIDRSYYAKQMWTCEFWFGCFSCRILSIFQSLPGPLCGISWLVGLFYSPLLGLVCVSSRLYVCLYYLLGLLAVSIGERSLCITVSGGSSFYAAMTVVT